MPSREEASDWADYFGVEAEAGESLDEYFMVNEVKAWFQPFVPCGVDVLG